jgi:hypothetical protein
MMPECELDDNDPLHEYLKNSPMITEFSTSTTPKSTAENSIYFSIFHAGANTSINAQQIRKEYVDTIDGVERLSENINHSIETNDKVKK